VDCSEPTSIYHGAGTLAEGDCWHGGGLFQDNNTVILNHKPDVAKPHPNHVPHGLQVILKNHVHGEDDPLYSERLQRDGWDLKQEWVVENRGTR